MNYDGQIRPAQIKSRDIFDQLDAELHGSSENSHAVSTILNTSVREVSAARTLALIRPLFESFGIRQLIELTLDGVPACPVFQVIRDDTRSQYFNAGKGFTRIESMVSGLMEAVEVHCFERADPALLLSAAALSAADSNLELVSRVNLFPGEASQETVKDGTGVLLRGMDHRNNVAVLLPAEYVFRELEVEGITDASPNGIASGNSLAEALCHALGEMLERHALAGFFSTGTSTNNRHYQQIERVLPPPESKNIHRCLAELRQKDIHGEFVLISAAAGVAVFICFLDVPRSPGVRVAVQGYGAHPDPKIAMARALGEAVQILALCPVADDDATIDESDNRERVVMTSKQTASLDPALILSQRLVDYELLGQLRSRMELIDYDYMSIHDDNNGRYLTGVEAPHETSREALKNLLAGFEKMGYAQVFSCVISPPSLPVVVVKCFCPGLDCILGL
jgi:YcaO-like protein with predicted kinase domain